MRGGCILGCQGYVTHGRGDCKSNSPELGMGLDALRESTMARLDAVEGKHGESGKKGKAARGQVMSSHSGHDQESGFNFNL